MAAIVPYFHPTMVGFVDDHYHFLESLSLLAPQTLCSEIFYSPEDALEWVNLPHRRQPLAHGCFSYDQGLVHFDLSALEREITQPDRFRRISVLVVDYAMPTMNGLDLCAEVSDPDIRKILLTGVADEKLAVAAFNQGLIHRYVPKASLKKISEIYTHVADMQIRYFQQYGERITASLMTDENQFLWVYDVRQYVEQLYAELEAIEFYLLTKPRGYLLVDRYGIATRLVVLSPAELETEIEDCLALGPPDAISAELVRGNKLPFLMEDPRHYLGHETYPWDEVLYPVNRVGPWCVAVISNPPIDIDFDPAMSSYDAYLAQNN